MRQFVISFLVMCRIVEDSREELSHTALITSTVLGGPNSEPTTERLMPGGGSEFPGLVPSGKLRALLLASRIGLNSNDWQSTRRICADPTRDACEKTKRFISH